MGILPVTHNASTPHADFRLGIHRFSCSLDQYQLVANQYELRFWQENLTRRVINEIVVNHTGCSETIPSCEVDISICCAWGCCEISVIEGMMIVMMIMKMSNGVVFLVGRINSNLDDNDRDMLLKPASPCRRPFVDILHKPPPALESLISATVI